MQNPVKVLINVVIGLLLVLLVTVIVVIGQPTKTSYPAKPDFKELAAGQERKTAFFNYMSQLVKINNQTILNQREKLKNYREQANDLWWWQHNYVVNRAQEYGIELFDVANSNDWDKLLNRVDIVPASMALAQSANESAWGTSRFAVKGHNYFGQWCYKKGCGFVPKQRNAGAVHEVAKFASPMGSVKSYMQNINTHLAYKSLRQLRQNLRAQNKTITGLALADGLIQYSEKRQVYVDEIKQMIRYNKLDNLDTAEY